MLITFDALVEHGLAAVGPSSLSDTGMPWSFDWAGFPVTHENDNLYLIGTPAGTVRVARGEGEVDVLAAIEGLQRSSRIEALVAEGKTTDEAVAIVDAPAPAPVLTEEVFESPSHSYALVSSGEAEPEIPDFAHIGDYDASAAEVSVAPVDPMAGMVAEHNEPYDPMRFSVGEMTDISAPAVDLDTDPEKSELQEAQEELGIGGRIEIGAYAFRVVTGSKPERYGHGKTIEEAMYDLKHPGQLPPTVG